MKNKLQELVEKNWPKVNAEIKEDAVYNLLNRPDLRDHSDESLVCLLDIEVYQMSIDFID